MGLRDGKKKYIIFDKDTGKTITYHNKRMEFVTKVTMLHFYKEVSKMFPFKDIKWESL